MVCTDNLSMVSDGTTCIASIGKGIYGHFIPEVNAFLHYFKWTYDPSVSKIGLHFYFYTMPIGLSSSLYIKNFWIVMVKVQIPTIVEYHN